jgi:hypothetical protein
VFLGGGGVLVINKRLQRAWVVEVGMREGEEGSEVEEGLTNGKGDMINSQRAGGVSPQVDFKGNRVMRGYL